MPRDSREPEAVTVTPQMLREVADGICDCGGYLSDQGVREATATIRLAAARIAELEREVAVHVIAIHDMDARGFLPGTQALGEARKSAARAELADEAEKEEQTC